MGGTSSSEYCRVGRGQPASNRPAGAELMLHIVAERLAFHLLDAGFQSIFVSLFRFKR